jgi:delta-1-pyrroline-5-carboxylate synthetase
MSADPSPLSPEGARQLALHARLASRQLKSLGYSARQSILLSLASSLTSAANLARILEANERDVEAAKEAGMTPANFARLVMTEAKLATLAAGLRQLADPQQVQDPVNQLRKQTLVAEGLILQQRTVPLGVLLVIFESRPDVLPQLIGLAVLSSNGLLLKGGSEAKGTLTVLYDLCAQAITHSTGSKVNGTHLVALVMGRSAIAPLLALDDAIDLVIPRGGNALVKHVKDNTRIPVLGHADGVCHIYLDEEYGGEENLHNFVNIVVDAKCDYPAACNAVETVLVHVSLLDHPAPSGSSCASAVHYLLASLKTAGVTVKLGPRAAEAASQRKLTGEWEALEKAESMHVEYGDLALCLELVDSMSTAIQHIHTYGSSHTETILTSSASTAAAFLDQVDSACVFHNTSTRFADGFRMGLGAEVGISTSRIHARGPVGVEGLLTTKWTMRSEEKGGQMVRPFQNGERKFVHKTVDVQSKM